MLWMIRMWFLRMWFLRMWFLRMWIIHMWIIDIWLLVPAFTVFVCLYGDQSFRVERCWDMLQAICPGVGKDAVEVAAKRAIRPALTYTSRTRWPSMRTFCRWVRAEARARAVENRYWR